MLRYNRFQRYKLYTDVLQLYLKSGVKLRKIIDNPLTIMVIKKNSRPVSRVL